MKLYYPKSHYNKSHRGLVFPLLKPFIKGKGFTDSQRVEMYGVSENDFEFTEDLEKADLVLLTMAWNYYIKTKQEAMAVDFVKECGAFGKKVVAVNMDDFGVRVPYTENLIILRSSGYKSKFSKNEYALPPFIKDPLPTYCDRKEVDLRPLLPKPVIGFCGQANISRVHALKEIINIGSRNLRFYSRQSLQDPQHLLSSTFLRASVLNTLEKSSEVTTNFIRRKKYRAGVTSNKDSHNSTKEFYNNITDSDYILCVRGAGNFSIRFYETLAMGRIPIFINTDCALPFDELIDWKKHVVWVEYGERHKVADKVADFHSSLSEREFIDLQQANRKLWKHKLRLGGFFTNFMFKGNLI